jgi:hypothetical protein
MAPSENCVKELRGVPNEMDIQSIKIKGLDEVIGHLESRLSQLLKPERPVECEGKEESMPSYSEVAFRLKDNNQAMQKFINRISELLARIDY